MNEFRINCKRQKYFWAIMHRIKAILWIPVLPFLLRSPFDSQSLSLSFLLHRGTFLSFTLLTGSCCARHCNFLLRAARGDVSRLFLLCTALSKPLNLFFFFFPCSFFFFHFLSIKRIPDLNYSYNFILSSSTSAFCFCLYYFFFYFHLSFFLLLPS